MNIYFYNSLTKQKELFQPIKQNEVGIYSCGPTVYAAPHIGNYRSFLFSDLLHRFLVACGYTIRLVMNITDIDNKTIAAARAQNVSLKAYTRGYEEIFLTDLKKLNFLPIHRYPRASEHVPEMVAMIETLLAKGHAYKEAGSVYFRLSSFPAYGQLSGIDVNAQLVGASQRIEADEYERDAVSDFSLWKAYKPAEDGDVFYETTLGPGRPGWHIECSAMSQKYLGTHFDIHTGGIDNKFPHHENEIAQSVCATASPFVNYWLHPAHLMIEDEKMSKSLGNVYTLQDLSAKGATYQIIRYMLLSSHYRHMYNFTFVNIGAAEKALQRLGKTFHALQTSANTQIASSQQKTQTKLPSPVAAEAPMQKTIAQHRAAFYKHLADDLNTAGALGVWFELTHLLTKSLTQAKLAPADAQHARNFYHEADAIFGFSLATMDLNATTAAPLSAIPSAVQSLVAKRNALRAQKAFQDADAVREQLMQLGYQLIDKEGETIVQKKT